MAYEQKPGQGSLFINNSNNSKAPRYVGSIVLPSGERMRLSAWERTSQDGLNYLSLKVEASDNPQSQRRVECEYPATPAEAVRPTYRPQQSYQPAPSPTYDPNDDLPY